MDQVNARLRLWLSPVADRVDTATLARLGLGAMLVLAGLHKLLAPEAWTVYVSDWLAPWLVVTPAQFMLVNGWLEILVGGLLAADRSVVAAAAVAAVSLPATVAYLSVLVVADGVFADVLIRDIGLAVLAWVVLLGAVAGADG